MAPTSMRGSLRPNQSGPHSYVFLALLLMVVVLAFNYWSSSSKNSELLEQLSTSHRRHKVCYDEVQVLRKTSKNVEDSLEKTKREFSELHVQINELKMSEKGYIELIKSYGRNVSVLKKNYEDLINKTNKECEQQMEESRSRTETTCSKEKDDLLKNQERAKEKQMQQLQQQQQLREEQLQETIQQKEDELRKLQADHQQQHGEGQQTDSWSQKQGEGQRNKSWSRKQGGQQKDDVSQKQGEGQQKDSWSRKQGEGQKNNSWSQKQGEGQRQGEGQQKDSWTQKQAEGQQKEDQSQNQGKIQQKDSGSKTQGEGQGQSENHGEGQQMDSWSQRQQGEGQQKDTENVKQGEGQWKDSWSEKQVEGSLNGKPVQKEAVLEEKSNLEHDGKETTKPTGEKKELEDMEDMSQTSEHTIAVPAQDDSPKERNDDAQSTDDGDGTLSNSLMSSQSQQPKDTKFRKANTTWVLQPPEAKDPHLLKFGTDHAPGLRPAHWVDRARRPDELQRQMQQGSTGIQSAGAFAGERENKGTSSPANKTESLEGQRGISTNVKDASKQEEKMIGKPGQREVAGSPGQLGGITNVKDKNLENIEMDMEGGKERVESIQAHGYPSHGEGQGEGQYVAKEES